MTSQSIARFRTLIAQHDLWLDGISTKIEIRIYKEGELYCARVSHDIQTPGQHSPYADTAPRADHDYVLDKAISAFTSYYDIAVKEGHLPDVSWLVPNENPWDQ